MNSETTDKLVFSTIFSDHYKNEEEYISTHDIYSSVEASFIEELDSLWEEFFALLDEYKLNQVILLTGTLTNGDSVNEAIQDIYKEFIYIFSGYDDIRIIQVLERLFIDIYRSEGVDHIEIKFLNNKAISYIKENFNGNVENMDKIQLQKLSDDKYSNKIRWKKETLMMGDISQS